MKMAIPVLCALMPQMAFVKIVKCMLDARHIRAKSLGLCKPDMMVTSSVLLVNSSVSPQLL